MAYLREKGFVSVVYLDDFLCIGSSYNDCLKNMSTTIDLLNKLGFLINKDKREFVPAKSCKFLGLIFNTKNMTISISVEKRQSCLNLINTLLSKNNLKVRFLAQVIGTLISVCAAIKYGILYTKSLERCKFLTLKRNNNNYEKSTILTNECKEDLRWWSKNIMTSVTPIRKNNYKTEIFSDASTTGWGASCGSETSSGLWTEDEAKLHSY